jgi:hypothetical protein
MPKKAAGSVVSLRSTSATRRGQGAYRGPAGDVRVFMTFGQLTMSKAD